MVAASTAEEAALVLAVDDNADALYALERMLKHNGFRVCTAASGKEALAQVGERRPSVILLDVMMPEMDGLEVTARLKADPHLRFIPILLLTAKDTLDDVVAGLDAGADGYITKPFKAEELLARTRAALRIKRIYDELRSSEEKNTELLNEISGIYDFSRIIGKSAAIEKVFALARKVAQSDSSVLITGKSGTGKELLARAIHYGSARRGGAFIAKNCAAFSEHLLESQLFGHVKGAFTGAVRDQKGLFEAADGGTLFLDEIGEMPLELQAKLLRVLQDGTFMPVGTTEERQVDVRVLAATNRNLRRMCEEGTFREDLYFRLNVITILIPSLGERREDIPLLIEHFLKKTAEKRGERQKNVSSEALKYLLGYSWPGNIRELENEIQRMLILGGEDAELGADLLSSHILESVPSPGEADLPAVDSATVGSEQGLKAAIEQLERKMIAEALERSGGNKTNAAKELGVSRSNLISKVQQYGLE